MRLHLAASLTAFTCAVGCTGTRVVPVEYEPREPERNRYEADWLKASTPDHQNLTDWQAAGQRSLRERLHIEPSFQEVVRFNGEDLYAVSYRIDLRRGERLRVDLHRRSGSGRLFADVFEEIPPAEKPLYRLAYSPPSSRSFEFTAIADGPHVLRLQPEIGGSNEWDVAFRSDAIAAFPVEGASRESISSIFGDTRDGGLRDHEGVDIVAPRGTPVVAIADAKVVRIQNTGRGGKVVWLHDSMRNVLYYYAHLDQQQVRPGATVRAGDRIGTVGNTGNARGSTPHLHFGVYNTRHRALNPLPFLHARESDMVHEPIDISTLGQWLTVDRDAVRLRAAPSTEAPVIDELLRHSRVLVVGSVRDWHRVRLEDGRSGFVAGFLLRS